MKSPFAGMDPYFEVCGLWEGFHSRLINKIDEALAPVLPRGYTIDPAVRSYVVLVETEGKDERLAKPDVTVTQAKSTRNPRRKQGGPATGVLAEDFEETFIEIYAQGEERILVTCIEVLSPSNKRRGTRGWEEYERKRQALLLGEANFIEIDLLRGGHRMPMMTPWPDSPYTILVSRASKAPRCRAWRADYRQRLPAIPVPLLDPDPDLTLDLQPLIDGIYSLGRYDERIDYAWPLTPVWPRAEAAAVRALLK